MKHFVATGSLQPLYVDLIDPQKGQGCYKCGITLKSGVGIFLLAEQSPQPFGPVCGKVSATAPVTGLPNLAAGIEYDPDDDNNSETATNSRTGSPHTKVSKRDFDCDSATALSYLFLRYETLPSLGFTNDRLRWNGHDETLNIYRETGEISPAAVDKIKKTMLILASRPDLQFLSFKNLLACRTFAWLSQSRHYSFASPSNF